MRLNTKLLVVAIILIALFSIGTAVASDNANLNSSDLTQGSNDIVSISEDTSDIETNDLISANPIQDSQDSENEIISNDKENNQVLSSSNDDEVLGKTITVNGKWFVNIRTAYNDAKNGDVIDLSGNIYSGENSELKFIANKRVTIANGVLDGSISKFQGISTIKNCVLENITFKNYRTTDRHPFGMENVVLRNVKFDNFINNIACLNVRNCVFENVTLSNIKSLLNETEGGNYERGAMIVSYYSTYNNCKFINLSTNHHSGAICVAGEATNTITITNSQFINCSSGVGGAVYVHGNHRTSPDFSSKIINCTFINNKASQWGGAIGSSQHYLLVENCSFINNTAKQGSAFMVGGIEHGLDGDHREGHYNTIKDCYFLNNTGTDEGGAVHIWGNNCSAINCTFEDNYAKNGKGAAIYVKGSNASVIKSRFYYHESERGTIYIIGENAEIINSTFMHNIATRGGAGAYIEGNNTIIDNSIFEDNNATIHGGALHLHGDYIRILESKFTSNHAHPNPDNADYGLGGAIYIIGNFNDIAYCDFIRNSAINGSAIYNRGKHLTIEDIEFIDNQAWSYLLITTATPESSNYSKSNSIDIKITHIGGANIIHAIYNDGDVADIIFFNVTYEHSTAKGDVLNTGTEWISPADGVENSNDGKLIYQDTREDSQVVRIIVVKDRPSNGLLGAPLFDGEIVHDELYKTGHYGNVSLRLRGLKPGTYTVYAEHPENTLYTYINNVTRFEIFPYVDLSIEKSSDKDSYFVGDIATYTITVSSLGSDAKNVVVNEMLPDSLEIISYDASKGSFNITSKIWSIGTLKSEETANLILKVKMTAEGTFTNTVNVTCDDEDVNLTNNAANNTVVVKEVDDDNSNETDDSDEDNQTDSDDTSDDPENDTYYQKTGEKSVKSTFSALKGHATGNPILLALLSLMTIGIGIRRKN